MVIISFPPLEENEPYFPLRLTTPSSVKVITCGERVTGENSWTTTMAGKLNVPWRTVISEIITQRGAYIGLVIISSKKMVAYAFPDEQKKLRTLFQMSKKNCSQHFGVGRRCWLFCKNLSWYVRDRLLEFRCSLVRIPSRMEIYQVVGSGRCFHQ